MKKLPSCGNESEENNYWVFWSYFRVKKIDGVMDFTFCPDVSIKDYENNVISW